MQISHISKKISTAPNIGVDSKLSNGCRKTGFTDADGIAAAAIFEKIQTGRIKTELLKLSEIVEHGFLQIRDRYDDDTIAELAGRLGDKHPLPPICVLREPGTGDLYVIDGVYRLRALRRLNAQSVAACIVDCNLRQALLLRLMLNGSHAQPLTADEKTRAIRRLLRDEHWAQCSDREIARYCGSYGAMVARVRTDVNASAKISQMRLIHRPGCRPYYMDTGKINRNRNRALPAAETGTRADDNTPAPPPADRSEQTAHHAKPPAETRKAAEINEKYKIKPGDIIVMHDSEKPELFYIIYCGDSRDKRFFDAVFADHKPGLLIADIPWNVNLKMGGHFRNKNPRELDTIANDALPSDAYRQLIGDIFSNCARHLLPGSAFYVFFGLSEMRSVMDELERFLGRVRQTVVWCKSRWVQSAGYHKNRHELAFFGWTSDNLRCWLGENSQSTVFDEKLLGGSADELPPGLHPCPKPVSVIRRMVELCLEPGGVALDPVMGSGTTLAAAAQAGCSAVGVELVPEFCAVAVNRLVMDCFGAGRGRHLITDIAGLPGVMAERARLAAEKRVAAAAAEDTRAESAGR